MRKIEIFRYTYVNKVHIFREEKLIFYTRNSILQKFSFFLFYILDSRWWSDSFQRRDLNRGNSLTRIGDPIQRKVDSRIAQARPMIRAPDLALVVVICPVAEMLRNPVMPG